jgi:hypothetical protein
MAMALSVYDMTVPVMVHGLNVLDDYLDVAQELERTRSLPPGDALSARLAPDMLTLGEQFSVSCNKAEFHLRRMLGQPASPPPPPATMMYPALKGRLVDTRGVLQQVKPADLEGAEMRAYELSPPVARGWFGGDDYIRHLVLPDFFFHVAVVHAILRQLGAPVGKRDYLGHVSP